MTRQAPVDTRNAVLLPGAVWGITGSAWVASLGPYPQRRYMKSISFMPPSTATIFTSLIIWNETTKIAIASSGLSTGWAPQGRVVPLEAGCVAYCVWGIATGTVPEVTFYSEQD